MSSERYINGKRLRYLREARGYTQRDLSSKVDAFWEGEGYEPERGTAVALRQIERNSGPTSPGSPWSRALQQILIVDVHWLYDEAPPTMPVVPQRYQAVMATRAKYK